MEKQSFKLSEVEGIPSPRGRARGKRVAFTLSEVDSSSPNKGRLGGVSIGNNCKSIPIPNPSLIREGSRKAAFTLAEVLITLGIIGVVAAITMPILIQKQNEKATVTKLKKVYSTLSQAYNMAVQEYGTPDEWGFSSLVNDEENGTDNDTNRNSCRIMSEKLGKYLKLIKYCTPDNRAECTVGGKIDHGGILSDGTIFYTFPRSGDCSSNYGNSPQLQNVCGDIYVYLKGNDKTQKWGKDIFAFHITKYGIFPKGSNNETRFSFDNYCYWKHPGSSQYGENWEYGEGCAAWVLYNENMDYLHCDDLSWNGKTKCK